VFDQRPSDRELLTDAVAEQRRRLGRVPRLVTADAGYYAPSHERAVEEMGVKWVAVPNRNTHSAAEEEREESLVQEGASVEDRLRRPHQRTETTARITAAACITGQKE